MVVTICLREVVSLGNPSLKGLLILRSPMTTPVIHHGWSTYPPLPRNSRGPLWSGLMKTHWLGPLMFGRLLKTLISGGGGVRGPGGGELVDQPWIQVLRFGCRFAVLNSWCLQRLMSCRLACSESLHSWLLINLPSKLSCHATSDVKWENWRKLKIFNVIWDNLGCKCIWYMYLKH